MATLSLKDDIDTVDFVSDANAVYFLLEDTFECPPPNPVDIRSSRNSNKIIARRYENRTVRFSYLLKPGNTNLNAAISKVYRMLERASSRTYLDGDAYQQNFDYSNGNTTGDNGLILRVKLGDTTGATVRAENEASGGGHTEDRIFTFRVVAGTQQPVSPFSVKSKFEGSEKIVLQIDVELECEPYALGESRIVHDSSTTTYKSVVAAIGNYAQNRIFIPAASIPGDAPALTRITTKVSNALGIIMGRHGGQSCLLNTPSFPEFTGGTNDKNDMMVGGYTTATSSTISVKITSTGTPNQFQYSINGGAYTGTTSIKNHFPHPIGATGLYVQFMSSTGHTLDNIWTFNNHQAFILSNSTGTQVGTDDTARANFLGVNGISVGFFRVNVPRQARGKYRVLAQVETSYSGSNIAVDFRMQVAMHGVAGGTSKDTIVTKPSIFDWVRKPSDISQSIVDLGTIDLSPTGLPFFAHPGASGMLYCGVYARGTQIKTDSLILYVRRVALVPAQDDDAFLWTSWIFDGDGREVYSNYDYNNPYIAEISATYSDKVSGTTGYGTSGDVDLTNIFVTGLDESHIGRPITLAPGVDNTVMFAPVINGAPGDRRADFRYSYWQDSANTGSVIVAIRPRYLFVG